MRRRGVKPAGRLGAALAAASAAWACELTEVGVAELHDVVVVEALAQPLPSRGVTLVTAFLHRTVQGAEGRNDPVPGARVVVRAADGTSVVLAEVGEPSPCVESTPLEGTGTCYRSEGLALQEAGSELTLEVRFPGGGFLEGRSRVPGSFLLTTPGVRACVLGGDSLDVRWTRSEGAWAYLAETVLHGLPGAVAELGLDPPPDPLYLRGLAISEADTSVVFPAEFGLFERADLERDLAVLLQGGLPDGAWADVAISAMDRNLVNWMRGGSFNPSGRVRVPSLRGDGTGFFGSIVTRGFRVWTPAAVRGVDRPPPCA